MIRFQSAPPSPGETHAREHARGFSAAPSFNPLPRRRGRPTWLDWRETTSYF